MDSALFNALKRQQELRDELNEIERFVRLYNKFKTIGSPQQTLIFENTKSEHVSEHTEVAEATVDENAAEIGKRGWTKELLKPHIREVIAAAGRPLTRSQLLKALDARGAVVGGSNRPKNMGTIMWRLSEDFVSLEGLGYWNRDTPFPEASYDPSVTISPDEASRTKINWEESEGH